MNEYTLDELKIGDSAEFTKTITEEMEDSFRAITGDENPLHKDDEFAAQIGKGKFDSHVAFGMLTASLLSTMAGMYLPGKYSLIHSIDEISFRAPVYAGDKLTVKGEITDINYDLKLIVVKVLINNQNKKTVSKAKMKIIVLK